MMKGNFMVHGGLALAVLSIIVLHGQLSSSTSDDFELRVYRDETKSKEDVGQKLVNNAVCI